MSIYVGLILCTISIALPAWLAYFPWPVWFTTIFLPIIYILMLVYFVFYQFERNHRYWWICFFVITISSTIFAYASVYSTYGITQEDFDHITVGNDLYSYSEAIYFSIVTWTTLGYGDLAPAKQLRLLAGVQALLGYISMGVLVGCLAATASEARKT